MQYQFLKSLGWLKFVIYTFVKTRSSLDSVLEILSSDSNKMANKTGKIPSPWTVHSCEACEE